MCKWIRFLLANEFLQFFLSDKGLNLLLEVIAISCIVIMFAVEMAILIPRMFLESLFSFPENVRAFSSLIYIRT